MQLSVAAVTQLPVPLQCDSGWYVIPEHDADPQLTVLGCCAQAPLPLHWPVLPHVPFAAHSESDVPAATFAHVPALLHALQAPQLPTLQQTPSVQKPLPHWLADEHCMPSPVWLMQVLPLQKKPLTQSALLVQVVRQLAPLQTYAPQLCVAGWVHALTPSQCDAGWNVDPVHEAPAPHDALTAGFWQAPAPLQAPVLPHGAAAGHCPAGAVMPTGMLVHVPALLDRLQDWHVPHAPALQQTPSVQNSLLHSCAAPQLAPSAFFATQLPAVLPLPVQ